jgi:hypothetical protein
VAALVAAAVALAMTIAIWESLSAYQGMWPLPALYLIEVAALPIIAAVTFFRREAWGLLLTWVTVGVLSAFCILGSWSVGFLYLPTTLILAVISVTCDVRNQQPIAIPLAVWLIAALAQAGLMLTVIRLL